MILSKIKNFWAAHTNNDTNISLFLPSKIANYFAFEGHKDIEGWMSAETLTFVKYIADFQNKNAIKGNIAEIGVYHGRLFIGLCLMLNTGEKGVAIDVFEEQEYNLDNSGKGDFSSFIGNLETKLGTLDHLEILKSDSMQVKAAQLFPLLDNSMVRLFSVDGCHTTKHTVNDLQLASKVLTNGGVIILDDFRNPEWPGVEEGLIIFLKENRFFHPFAIAYNKLYLAKSSFINDYQKYVQTICSRYSETLTYLDVAEHKVLNMSLPVPEHCFADCFLNFFDFSSSISTQALLGDGWFSPEPWGIWSDGTKTAEITLPLKKGQQENMSIYVSFHAFVSQQCAERRVNVFINTKMVDSIMFTKDHDYYNWRYQLPDNERPNPTKLKLSFAVENAISPKEIGLSEDSRKLGVGLRNIRLFAQS